MTDETRQTPAETASHPWRCFHCDDVFTSRSEASAHFGHEIDATPACKIAPDLRGLVKFIRWQEDELQRYRREDSDAARQFYAIGAEHAAALRREEEKGYARGLVDGREEAPYPKSDRDQLGRRVDPAPMPEALKDTIATCYGLLWAAETDNKRVHRARAGLLQWLTKDEQVRGIEMARGVALMVGLPPEPEGER